MGLGVKARIFNMRFWGEGFEHENVRFIPLPNHRDILKKAKKARVHAQTGRVLVHIPDEIKDPNEAIKYTRELLSDYAYLLIFAHCHDVFFREYYCYEIKNGSRELKTGEISTIRTGKPPITAPIVYEWGMKDFIHATIPLICNDIFVDETGIYWSLIWLDEALNLYPIVTEIKFPTLFISLEILANAHAKAAKIGDFLTDNEFRKLKRAVQGLLENKMIDTTKRNELFGKLGDVKRKSIHDRITELLATHNLTGYESEIRNFIELRNDILHGRRIVYEKRKESSIDTTIKLQRLLQKLVLSILKCYDKDYMHSAIKRQDLLARF